MGKDDFTQLHILTMSRTLTLWIYKLALMSRYFQVGMRFKVYIDFEVESRKLIALETTFLAKVLNLRYFGRKDS